MNQERIEPDFDLTRTSTAIDAYDKANDAFTVADVSKMPQGEALAKLQELETLAEKVGEAFGLDTAPLNSVDTCRSCVRPGNKAPGPGEELSFVRRMVKKWKRKTSV